MQTLDANFWKNRYAENQIGWDIGHISTPLKEYFDQIKDKTIHILIPGAGNAYEAEYLHKQGFKNVTVVDWAKEPLNNFSKRNPDFPTHHLIQSDFFKLEGQYDMIVEQTFFCAINPELRKQYVEHTHKLLKQGGKLVGLFFNIPLNESHPPFGGCKEEYLNLFAPHYDIKNLETSYNSIEPRKGNELFAIMLKK